MHWLQLHINMLTAFDNAHSYICSSLLSNFVYMCYIIIIIGIYADVVQKVQDNYNDLINLNATAMLPSLYAKSVITLVNKDTISITKPLERDKMQYLLDQIIIPSLQAGVIQKFKLFLEVMEKSDDVVTKTMAQKLGTWSYVAMYSMDNALL